MAQKEDNPKEMAKFLHNLFSFPQSFILRPGSGLENVMTVDPHSTIRQHILTNHYHRAELDPGVILLGKFSLKKFIFIEPP